MKKSLFTTIRIITAVFVALLPVSVTAAPKSTKTSDGIIFQFNHKKGDAVSHVATVEEEAYINGQLNNRTEL